MPVEKKIFKNREEWLKGREDHIGGSDASACMGMNPYKSNVQLWEEKTGRRTAKDISGKDYVQYGIQAEAYLRELFALDYPQYQVTYEDHNMFLNTEYPWMHASLDGELTDSEGRKGILEIKTTTIMHSSQWEKWKDRIPENYYIQILHYLAVTCCDFAILKAQIKQVRGQEVNLTIRHYHIERKDVEADIEMVIEAEHRFWDCVVSGRKPDLILPAI